MKISGDIDDMKDIGKVGCAMALFFAIPAGVLVGTIAAIIWCAKHL